MKQYILCTMIAWDNYRAPEQKILSIQSRLLYDDLSEIVESIKQSYEYTPKTILGAHGAILSSLHEVRLIDLTEYNDHDKINRVKVELVKADKQYETLLLEGVLSPPWEIANHIEKIDIGDTVKVVQVDTSYEISEKDAEKYIGQVGKVKELTFSSGGVVLYVIDTEFGGFGFLEKELRIVEKGVRK